MNILGIGPAELILVFMIALAVAGPKRMIQWAYTIGRYVAQMRAMFQETVAAIQKEINIDDLNIPTDLTRFPTKPFDIVSEANKVINSELKDSLSVDLDAPPAPTAATATSLAAPSGPPAAPASPDNGSSPAPEAGPAPDSDGEKPRYGTWTPN